MESRGVRRLLRAMAVAVVGLGSASSQSNQSSNAPSAVTTVKPLVLEKNEGELRTRRIHTDASISASAQFMLKVSPRTMLSISWRARKNWHREPPYRNTGTWYKMRFC
jgi:type IV pilus biogenesis protein CpaD/CtpE